MPDFFDPEVSPFKYLPKSMRRKFFKLLKATPFLASALMFCLYQGANLHDSGIPSDLARQQHEKVVEAYEEWVEVVGPVCDAMDEYIAHPQDQTQMIQQLLRKMEACESFYERLGTFPEIFSPAVKLPDDVSQSVNETKEKFEAASKRFTTELIRRVDAGEHDADYEGYLSLEDSFQRVVDFSEAQDYCDTEECFWCKCRTYWNMN